MGIISTKEAETKREAISVGVVHEVMLCSIPSLPVVLLPIPNTRPELERKRQWDPPADDLEIEIRSDQTGRSGTGQRARATFSCCKLESHIKPLRVKVWQVPVKIACPTEKGNSGFRVTSRHVLHDPVPLRSLSSEGYLRLSDC